MKVFTWLHRSARNSRITVTLPILGTVALMLLVVTPGHEGRAKELIKTQTILNTDFASAGIGGLRNAGIGNIVLSGISGEVTRAYLYWQGPTNSLDPNANASVAVNGTLVTGVNIGFSGSSCWAEFSNSQAYRADVTSLVAVFRNGSYHLTNFTADSSVNVNGASLIVFYDDGIASNNRNIVLVEGNDDNFENSFDGDGWNVTVTGINRIAGSASIQLHVADGQGLSIDAPIILNGATLAPAGEIFAGTSVPSELHPAPAVFGLWDIVTFDVSSLLPPGTNTLSLNAGLLQDCLSLVLMVINLPATSTTVCPSPPGAVIVRAGSTGAFMISNNEAEPVTLSVAPFSSRACFRIQPGSPQLVTILPGGSYPFQLDARSCPANASSSPSNSLVVVDSPGCTSRYVQVGWLK